MSIQRESKVEVYVNGVLRYSVQTDELYISESREALMMQARIARGKADVSQFSGMPTGTFLDGIIKEVP